MKNLIYLPVVLICLVCLSCKQDKCCVVPAPKNSMTASRGDSLWQIFNPVSSIHLDTLIIADTSVNPQRSELLVFKLKFNGKGNYTLTSANVTYGYVPQMDNPYVYYTLDTSFPNSFTVDYFDSSYGLMLGDFSIKLNKSASNTDDRYPQSVTFLNGSFRVQLSK